MLPRGGYGPIVYGPFEYPERRFIRGFHFSLGLLDAFFHRFKGFEQKREDNGR